MLFRSPLRLVRATTAELASTELVLENDRRELLLHGGEAQIELDLDISTMPNTPYRDLEIEAELVSGTTQVLDDIASLISAIGPVTPSSKGKRARGWAYLRRHQALSRASAQT